MTSAGPLTTAALLAQLRIDWELTILCILLIMLIVAGCVAVVRVRRRLHEDAAPLSLDDYLHSYQALVERGELAPQEFERLKARLQQKLGEKAAEPPPPESPV